MENTVATLRQITDAIALHRGEDAGRLYSRVRTMRDRGLIFTTSDTWRGKEIAYSAPEIVGAIVAINVSLNGGSTGQIETINYDMRRDDLYSLYFERMAAGEDIFIRYDIYSHPWAFTKARIGTLQMLDFSAPFLWSDAYNHPHAITQTILLPVTALAQPIFALLNGES